jgi:hypothetical protein
VDPNRTPARRLVHLLLVFPAVLLSSPTPTAAQAPAGEQWYERMRFAGDFRVRHESFFLPDSSPRGRMRIRFRMGFILPISPRVTTGLRLASSEPGSVTSHNVSLSGELTPKHIVLDRAWLTWTPNRRVTLTAGKFANPLSRPDGLMRTEMVFDDEVSPEGLHEELVIRRSDSGLVRHLALRAEQWSLRERADSSDVWLVGGQVAGQLGFGRTATVSLAGSYLAYRHGDQLAAARNANRALLITNAVVLLDGTIVEGGKAISPTTGNPFVRFRERFRLLNGSVGVTVPRAIAGLPVSAYLDAVHNAGAEEHRTGYWAGVTVGPGGRARGWAATVVRTRVEREAVLSMYSYSDLGLGGTNLEGTIFQVAWRPAAGILLSVRDHIIRPILPVDGVPDRALHRLQLDAGVSF